MNLDAARERFGARVDWLGNYLLAGDPLADEAVAELAAVPDRQRVIDRALGGAKSGVPALDALMAAVHKVPAWVRWEEVDRGGQVLFRAGVAGGIVLGAKALVYGYAAPAGNKPLVFSGQLKTQAPRRLNETAKFVAAVCR